MYLLLEVVGDRVHNVRQAVGWSANLVKDLPEEHVLGDGELLLLVLHHTETRLTNLASGVVTNEAARVLKGPVGIPVDV